MHRGTGTRWWPLVAALGLTMSLALGACAAGAPRGLVGMTADGCRTLGSARTEVARLAEGTGERTAEDTRARIVEILGTTGDLLAGLESVPAERPTAALPVAFRDSRAAFGSEFSALWQATGCPDPTVSPAVSAEG